jgi:opacity protein-like surface antigen
LAATTAQAKGVYVGVEANKLNLTQAGQSQFYKTDTYAPSLVLGYSLPVVDLEINYLQSSGSKAGLEDASQGISNGSTTVKLQTLGLDAVKTFKPFDAAPKLGVFGLVGINYSKVDISESGDFFGQPNNAKSSGSGLGYSYGAGVSYEVAKNCVVRVKVKQSVLNISTAGLAGTGGVKNATAVSVGALYHF